MKKNNLFISSIEVIYYTPLKIIEIKSFNSNLTFKDIFDYFKLKIKKKYSNLSLKNSYSYKDKIIKEKECILTFFDDNSISYLDYQNIYIELIDKLNKNEYILKPKNNPFSIIIYSVNFNSISIKNLDNSIIESNNLENYNSEFSSYCNSNNTLFISGGIDKNKNPIKDFWIINYNPDDLTNIFSIKKVEMPESKNKHSMIYNEKDNSIIIVAGNNNKCLLYNIKNEIFLELPEINNICSKPALIIKNNWLYVFDSFNRKRNYFEKLDLYKMEKFELFYPNNYILFNNKFFGVCQSDINNNIIILGGEKNGPKTLIYDISKNYLLYSKGKDIYCKLNDKNFYKINSNYYANIDDLKENNLITIDIRTNNVYKIKFDKEGKTNFEFDLNEENKSDISVTPIIYNGKICEIIKNKNLEKTRIKDNFPINLKLNQTKLYNKNQKLNNTKTLYSNNFSSRNLTNSLLLNYDSNSDSNHSIYETIQKSTSKKELAFKSSSNLKTEIKVNDYLNELKPKNKEMHIINNILKNRNIIENYNKKNHLLFKSMNNQESYVLENKFKNHKFYISQLLKKKDNPINKNYKSEKALNQQKEKYKNLKILTCYNSNYLYEIDDRKKNISKNKCNTNFSNHSQKNVKFSKEKNGNNSIEKKNENELLKSQNYNLTQRIVKSKKTFTNHSLSEIKVNSKNKIESNRYKNIFSSNNNIFINYVNPKEKTLYDEYKNMNIHKTNTYKILNNNESNKEKKNEEKGEYTEIKENRNFEKYKSKKNLFNGEMETLESNLNILKSNTKSRNNVNNDIDIDTSSIISNGIDILDVKNNSIQTNQEYQKTENDKNLINKELESNKEEIKNSIEIKNNEKEAYNPNNNQVIKIIKSFNIKKDKNKKEEENNNNKIEIRKTYSTLFQIKKSVIINNIKPKVYIKKFFNNKTKIEENINLIQDTESFYNINPLKRKYLSEIVKINNKNENSQKNNFYRDNLNNEINNSKTIIDNEKDDNNNFKDKNINDIMNKSINNSINVEKDLINGKEEVMEDMIKNNNINNKNISNMILKEKNKNGNIINIQNEKNIINKNEKNNVLNKSDENLKEDL